VTDVTAASAVGSLSCAVGLPRESKSWDPLKQIAEQCICRDSKINFAEVM
jgi:hypothetical protein